MKKGDIYLIEFMSFKGHEQKGMRPGIIVSDKIANLVIVVPLTSNTKALQYDFTLEINPSKENGLDLKSIAMSFQIRAIDVRQINKKLGKLDKKSLDNINNQIKSMLKLK